MPKPCRPSPPSGFAILVSGGSIFRGWSLAESGKLSDGIAQMRDGLAAYEATGAKAYASDIGILAEVHRRAGNADQGQRLLNDALDRTKRHVPARQSCTAYKVSCA